MNIQQKKAVDFSRSSISRYIQLATLFRRRIESGQWPVGSQIPTVEELASECGVARATIRQALDILEREQLIERYRAKGTFVRRHPQEELWCAVGTDWSGLLRPSHSARIEVLSDTPDVRLEHVLYQIGELAPAYRHLHRRHWRHDQPFLLTDVYIDERLRDRITKEDIETKTALRLVADIPDLEIINAQQTLTIGTADMETAESLSMPLNAPVAYVHRRAVDSNGIAVLIAQGIYRGEVVRFDIKLK
ncbi:GntR family transcriptional regulator [Chelativorans sp. AA-79]|uniref:GntR family transcriptional regulator n=1 Tax=Chelativorans sp. AA-79 TaxID=3028735 RepID=UPI0023F94FE3|nr:GntR family transcriptional regulator [Chelativorans sp. AA-79]WEX08715.1 GntR family transcriptional regulator [Chelativorans sp. AA-79]